MKKFLFIFCLFFLLSCGNKSNNEQPQALMISTENIQYDIRWNDYSNIDVRIITLEKNNEAHDYVVAASWVGKGSGVSIEHWAGCKCLKK